jgi:hypothetical protein
VTSRANREPDPPPEPFLPFNVEAEAAVLGGILIDADAREVAVAAGLVPRDFYRLAHEWIYATMLDLRAANTPSDLLIVCDALDAVGKLEEVGGTSFVSALANNVPSSANVLYYARIVKRLSIARQRIKLSGDLTVAEYARDHERASALVAQLAALGEPSEEVDAYPLRPVCELLALPPHRPLVEGVLWRGSTFHGFGAPGTGKTSTLEDIGGCIAANIPWHSHTVHHGHVVLIQNDSSPEATGEHMAGWLLTHPELTPEQVATYTTHFHVVTVPVRVGTPGVVDATIRQWGRRLDTPPVCILVDSLSTTAGDTNSNEEMATYATCVRRWVEAWGATAGVINHVGWGDAERPRGGTALVGNFDTVLRWAFTDAKAKLGTLTHYRDRFSAGVFAFPYRIDSQALEGARMGRTCPIITPLDATQAQVGTVPVTVREMHALRVLQGPEGRPEGLLWSEWLGLLEVSTPPWSRDAFNAVLRQLAIKALVWKVKEGRQSRYFLTPAGLGVLGVA